MRAIVPAFATWCEQVRKAMRQAQIKHGIVAKWTQRGLATAWDSVSHVITLNTPCMFVTMCVYDVGSSCTGHGESLYLFLSYHTCVLLAYASPNATKHSPDIVGIFTHKCTYTHSGAS